MSYHKNNMNYFALIILKVITLINITKCLDFKNNSYIILPIYTKSENKSSIVSSYYKEIYTKIDIGSNNQQIEMKVQLNNYPLYLVEEKSVSDLFQSYIPKNSKSYSSIIESFFYDKDFKSGIISEEYFRINSTKIKICFRFILAQQISYFPIIPPGSIGLGISPPSSIKVKNINFIDQLRTNSIISDYSFSFIFNEKDSDKIIIGSDLDKITKGFENSEKIIIKAGTNERQIDWGFSLKDVELIINSTNTNVSCFCNDNAIFDLSNEFIISTYIFSSFIKKYFFNKLLDENICVIEEINNVNYFSSLYRIIKCDKSANKYIMQNFPIIKFVIKDINYFSFNFTYQDLFFFKNEYIYFKIIIYHIENDLIIDKSLYTKNRWIFGKLFFKKYNISLNQDKKIIIFYINNKDKKEDNKIYKSENSNKSKFEVIIWILILILFIMGLCLFHFIKKNFWLTKRINNKNRKNFLVNEMEYFTQYDN